MTKRPWNRRITAVLGWSYLALVIAALALLWLAGDRWWVATLLTFGPRWVILAPLSTLVPLALFFHRRALAPLAAGAGLVAGPLMGLCAPWRSLTAGAFSVGFLVSAAISPSLGWLVDRYGPRVVIEIGVGLLASGSPTLLYIMVGSQGMLGYSLTSVIGAIPAEIFEGRQFGAIYGTLMLAAIGGGALGPWVTGAFYDATAARFAVRSRRQRS